ncbi:UNVERIFIED_CONTAM: hypothetical protein GTU68_014415 [Idotea baltica]|nr:hypothetical protein [Idotea baltica]
MAENIRILVVEDELSLREGIQLNLELEGYEVITAEDGVEALQIFEQQRFNVIILDVMLPEMNGFSVCEKIRLKDDTIPVMFLTAKNAITDKLEGLKKGADDFMTKPFNLDEFLLRVKVLVKHSLKTTNDGKQLLVYTFGENNVNFSTYEAKGVTGKFNLSHKEAMLLKLLIERKGQVVPREEILSSVWGYDIYPSTRTIDNFISAFRKYFEENPKQPNYFFSVRSVGYKFVG